MCSVTYERVVLKSGGCHLGEKWERGWELGWEQVRDGFGQENEELGLPHVSRFVRDRDLACRKGNGAQDAFSSSLRVEHMAFCSLVDGFQFTAHHLLAHRTGLRKECLLKAD